MAQETPTILDGTKKYCEKCKKQEEEGVKFQVCAGCKWPAYCSRECQKADWATHGPVCRFKNGKATPEERKAFMKTRVLPAPAEESKEETSTKPESCSCFDELDKHRFKAQEEHTCSNFGCSNKIEGPVEISINMILCNRPIKSGVSQHLFMTQYCSGKCSRQGKKDKGREKPGSTRECI